MIVTVWEFRDDILRYKDHFYDNCIKWEAFKGYSIIQGNLFLVLAESIDQSFMLDEAEVGAHEFGRIVEFVKEKMGYYISA